jgi:hypothetical protein
LIHILLLLWKNEKARDGRYPEPFRFVVFASSGAAPGKSRRAFKKILTGKINL